MKKLNIYDYDFLQYCEEYLEDENCRNRDMDFWFNQLADNTQWAEEVWLEYQKWLIEIEKKVKKDGKNN